MLCASVPYSRAFVSLAPVPVRRPASRVAFSLSRLAPARSSSAPGAPSARSRASVALSVARAALHPAFRAMAPARRRAAAVAPRSSAADAPETGAKKRAGPNLTTVPTMLTLVRVVAVPVVTWLYYLPGAWVAPTCCAIFIAAAITDWADGYLARKMNLVSSFGAFLDPVADKLMVAAALILLCTKTAAGVSVVSMAVPATIIIGREITMSAIREWAAAAGGEAHGAVAVNSYGKWKTATQLVALSILLGVRDGCEWLGLRGAAAEALVQGGVWCLYASAALALLSLWIYMAGVIEYMD